MIPIKRAPEPTSFDEDVRRPGLVFLSSCPTPASGEWKAYWKTALPAMNDAYSEVCAYYCFRIDNAVCWAEVDHFLPKSTHPELAYEWSNFRLSSPLANRAKGNQRVLDPFDLSPDTFRIRFLDGVVIPSPTLSTEMKNACIQTIEVLHLNRPELKRRRVKDFDDFVAGRVPLSWLEQESIFVAVEVKRLGIRSCTR